MLCTLQNRTPNWSAGDALNKGRTHAPRPANPHPSPLPPSEREDAAPAPHGPAPGGALTLSREGADHTPVRDASASLSMTTSAHPRSPLCAAHALWIPACAGMTGMVDRCLFRGFPALSLTGGGRPHPSERCFGFAQHDNFRAPSQPLVRCPRTLDSRLRGNDGHGRQMPIQRGS